jgi:hypothetical protein
MISEPAVVSAKYIFKNSKENKEDLGHLISQYAYSGHFNDFVTMLPESEEHKSLILFVS